MKAEINDEIPGARSLLSRRVRLDSPYELYTAEAAEFAVWANARRSGVNGAAQRSNSRKHSQTSADSARSAKQHATHKAIETYRGFVYPWSMDHVGHMNVQFYTAPFDEATWHFLAELGISPRFMKEHGRAAVAADQRTQYKREVVAGTLLHISTELLALGKKSIRFVHRMYDSETGDEVAVTELVGVYFDTAARSRPTCRPSFANGPRA